MNVSLKASAELLASLERMKARTWRDADAEAFERGAIPTRAASKGVPPLKASRFTSRQRPRSPDRQASRDRRRLLAGSNVLPPNIRHLYTQGQTAVLCIIAGEIKHHGVCDLPIGRIASLAGVCHTTVQTTLHEARRFGHIKITGRPVQGRKNLTNLVHIVSSEWLTWAKRGPSAGRRIGSKKLNLVSATKNTELQKERFRCAERLKEAVRGEPRTAMGPPSNACRRA